MFLHPANLITLPDDAPPLARTFALIMQNLRQAVAERRRAHPDSLPRLMLVGVHAGRVALWLARLMLRLAEGRATPRRHPRPAPAADPETPSAEAAPRKLRPRLPTYHWLFPRVPEAAAYGSQLAHWLNQPETAALLAAAPHAAGRLRSLCRLLAVPWQNVTTIDLRPRERVRKPRPEPPEVPTLETAAPEPPAPAAPAAPALRYRRPWWMPPGRPWRHLIPDLRPTLDPATHPRPVKPKRA